MAESEEQQQPAAVQLTFAEKYRDLLLKERSFKKTLDIVLGLTGIGLSLLLFLLIFGKRLPILDYLGLRVLFVEKSGVYADCNDLRNRNSPYCQPKRFDADKTWETIARTKGKPLPFNLYRDE